MESLEAPVESLGDSGATVVFIGGATVVFIGGATVVSFLRLFASKLTLFPKTSLFHGQEMHFYKIRKSGVSGGVHCGVNCGVKSGP